MLDQAVPDFTLAATSGRLFQLSAFAGHPLVIYFYPKDSTPGCTTEAQQFRDLCADFTALGCHIVGISRDSVKSHENFRAKQNLPFELVSDPDEVACGIFGVMKMKNMYGRAVRGIERSTFLIDAKGILRAEWRGVKVDGHAAAVLTAVKAL